jgi:NTP pyrophosphatase (non-canonical NTP hydrolase)
MNSEKEQYLLGRSVELFGPSAQCDKTIEECAELIKALCKYRFANNNDVLTASYLNVIEEMADVQIMIDQLKIIFDRKGVFERIRQEKLARLQKMLQNHSLNRT